MTTIMTSPEPHGLTLMACHDIADVYEFDVVGVWRHDASGRYYAGHDAGCSCPAPFENTTVDNLTEVRTLADVERYASEAWGGVDSRWHDELDTVRNAVASLVDTLALRFWYVGPDRQATG